jgi:hypothetical protein
MGLDYVERERNTIADALAKDASGTMVSLTGKQFQLYFKLEKIMSNVKIKGKY